MSDTIKGSIIGALITVVGSILVFVLGNFSTQSTIEEKTVETLSGYFDSVDKDMSYEQALQTIYKENEQLKEENNSYISKLAESNEDISKLQSQQSNELNNLRQQYENEINSKYDVDFQNINLIINGIDTKYNDKVAIINDEKYYSMGFLQYLVDNEKISDSNKKLFVGSIQSEEKMPVSLFDLKSFTSGKLTRTTDEEDTFGNIYDKAFKVITSTLHYDDLSGVTEFYVNKQYSKFYFDVAYSTNAYQNDNYEIVIYGDNKQLKSIIVDRKTLIKDIEVDITGVEYLQIIGKGGYGGANGNSYYALMINPYLYP